MTGGTRHEWDSMAREVQAAIAKTRVNGGNFMICGCGSNKFASFKSRLRCESCGALYQKRERPFAKRELFTKHEQTGEVNMSGGMEESAWTYGQAVKESALDKQESGDHYKKMKIQPIEYITANAMPYLDGNVIKYISRHRAKGKADDIRKAIHYLQIILESEYGVQA